MSSVVSCTGPSTRVVAEASGMSKSKRRRPMAEINVVPYIDVMLVLLVIFMVTAPLMTQGINVDLPKAFSGAIEVGENEPVLVFTIKEDGSYYMNIGRDEEPVQLAQIAEQATKVVKANPGIKVLIEGDRNLSYGIIVNLMNVLQGAGISSVGLVTEPPAS